MATLNPYSKYKNVYCDNCYARNKRISSLDITANMSDLEEQETIFRCAKMRELI